MPCTTILVGKRASHDGSTLMARTEDSGAGHYTPKKMIVMNPAQQPRQYKSVISKVEIPLPEEALRYTAMPNADPSEGWWACAGINEANVAMTATETITSNPRMEGTDPLVDGGIGEEDMVTLVLPYIHSAREGVLRLGELLTQYGTYERNGIGFQDINELWWLESLGGHHWFAKRVPEDSYMICPNQQGIDFFDFVDAMGEGQSHLCSADLPAFVEKHHLNLHPGHAASETHFDARAAFGSHLDRDRVYNTPRAWFMLRYFNPSTAFEPEAFDLPWAMEPEKKITPEDIKYVLSSYYQSTPYNPYSHHGAPENRGLYRPIGINRTNVLVLTQLRPWAPAEFAGVEWVAFGSGAFNEMVPMYTNVRKVPDYLSNCTNEVSTDNLYWSSRLIAALADAAFGHNISDIDRYQQNLAVASRSHLTQWDERLAENRPESYPQLQALLEEANEEMAATAKEATQSCLQKVLFTTTGLMKNAFSRSDN